MTEIRDADALWALLARPVRGYAVGLLPPDVAPSDAVLWLAPVTLADVTTKAAELMLALGEEFCDADTARAVLLLAVQVDPEALTCGDGEPECDPDRLRPLFDGYDAVVGLGDPLVMGSVANQLLIACSDAGGFGAGVAGVPGSTVLDIRDRLRHRGRWVTGCLPADPEAALWVNPYTEAQRAQASQAAQAPIDATQYRHNRAVYLTTLLSHILRAGPGGPPLLTATDCARLPYGAACGLEYASHELTMTAGPAARTGFRHTQPRSADTGGGATPAVVRDGEVGPPTGDPAPAA